MPLEAIQNPPAKGRERFTSLPSATRRGIEGLCRPSRARSARAFQPLPFALLQVSEFRVRETRKPAVRHCQFRRYVPMRCLLLRWWAPVSRVQGPLRCHPPPFGARAGEAGPVLRVRPRLAPLSPSARHPPCIARKPSSHWNGSPPRTGVHRSSARGRALARLFIRAKARTPKRLAQIAEGQKASG